MRKTPILCLLRLPIATTVQQVAKGITMETESVTRTATSVEQMSQTINAVAKGTQEQTVSVANATAITNQINQTILRRICSAVGEKHEQDEVR